MTDELSDKTVDELIDIAGEHDITGRHDMRKAELIEAIEEATESEDDEIDEETVDEVIDDETDEEADESDEEESGGDEDEQPETPDVAAQELPWDVADAQAGYKVQMNHLARPLDITGVEITEHTLIEVEGPGDDEESFLDWVIEDPSQTSVVEIEESDFEDEDDEYDDDYDHWYEAVLGVSGMGRDALEDAGHDVIGTYKTANIDMESNRGGKHRLSVPKEGEPRLKRWRAGDEEWMYNATYPTRFDLIKDYEADASLYTNVHIPQDVAADEEEAKRMAGVQVDTGDFSEATVEFVNEHDDEWEVGISVHGSTVVTAQTDEVAEAEAAKHFRDADTGDFDEVTIENVTEA